MIDIHILLHALSHHLFQLESTVFSASYDLADTYDAYERDIAVVSFYFEQSTVFEYARFVIDKLITHI